MLFERGFSEFINLSGGAQGFVVLGPVPEGRVVRRVWFDWTSDGAMVLDVFTSLGRSQSGTVGAINAGVPIPTRSNNSRATFNSGGIRFVAGASGSGHTVVPVGVEVQGAPMWVVMFFVSLSASQMCLTIGVDVVGKASPVRVVPASADAG